MQYHDGRTFTWANGRRLSTVTDGSNTISYAYDADGIRSSKTVNGVTTKYLYADGKLMMINPNSYSNMMLFLYDDSGKPYGFRLGGYQTYYYEYNLQGDVIGIFNSSGSQYVWYTYDAWGKLVSIDGYYELGVLNPIRYRGYIYDNETGFYYLQSRYYDPNTGRFLNVDSYISTGQDILGFNMFAYCGNNPVIFKDSTGMLHERTAGGGGLFNCKMSRDVTEEVLAALNEDSSKIDSTAKSIFDISKRYWEFYNKVDHYAPWDIKRMKPWEETLNTPYPGKNSEFMFLGNDFTPEMLGNFTYGYLGYEYDIPLFILLIGSYCAADLPISGSALENELWDWEYITAGYKYAQESEMSGKGVFSL